MPGAILTGINGVLRSPPGPQACTAGTSPTEPSPRPHTHTIHICPFKNYKRKEWQKSRNDDIKLNQCAKRTGRTRLDAGDAGTCLLISSHCFFVFVLFGVGEGHVGLCSPHSQHLLSPTRASRTQDLSAQQTGLSP